MPTSPRQLAKFPSLLIGLFILASPLCGQDEEDTWSSPRLALIQTTIDKKLDAPSEADKSAPVFFAPLPAKVQALLGVHSVDYPSFVVNFLPAFEAAALRRLLIEEDLSFSVQEHQELRLPWHVARTGDPASRTDPTFATLSSLRSTPVPNLWLVQFAYPTLPQWVTALADCGWERIAYLQAKTFLVRASTLAVDSCDLAPYLLWTGPYLTTDRVSPDLFLGSEEGEYWLQYITGSELAEKVRALPVGVLVEELLDLPSDEISEVRVTASRAELAEIIASDSEILSVSRHGEAALSDERQGQIIAGNHNGTSMTTPGYRTWLSDRGLLTGSNQQVVAVMDTGYDDGSDSFGSHHLDLENPERVWAIAQYGSPLPGTDDQVGHGSMVAGIIVGSGTATDAQGFRYGDGIAQRAYIFPAKLQSLRDTVQQQAALNDTHSSGARIANQSWNLRDLDIPAVYTPINDYEATARFFDARVLDARPAQAGNQPMSIVFSAGNYANNCNGLLWDTVASPAVAKNVIAVGATENYRPQPDPPLSCFPCTLGGSAFRGRAPDHDANHIADIADFSGRGYQFGPYPSAFRSNNTRIKPDLVAPAVRVFSSVPYQHNPYDIRNDNNVTGCSKYHPDSPLTYHTYGTGTSFAAPVVSGVVALLRKRMLDQSPSVDAFPSWIKAALVATADDLGDQGNNGNDHRPSPRYGWGRVNLNRLLDSSFRFSSNEEFALLTGQSQPWSKTIGSGSLGTFIVLAWSDPPTAINGDSQVAAVNDLDLRVNGGVWR